MYVLQSIGLAYSWKEIFVSNLQQVFTETGLDEVDLILNLSHARGSGRGGPDPAFPPLFR